METFLQATKSIRQAYDVAQDKQKRFLQNRKTRRGRHHKGPAGFLLHRNGFDIEVLASGKKDILNAPQKGIGVVVRSFGKFAKGIPYHTPHYFLCNGFRSHVVNKNTSPWTDLFESKVLDGGEAGPLFRVTDLRLGTNSLSITRRTPGRAWWDMLNKVNLSGIDPAKPERGCDKTKSKQSRKKWTSTKVSSDVMHGWDGARRVRVRLRVNDKSEKLHTRVLLSFRPYFCKEEPDIRNLRGSEVWCSRESLCLGITFAVVFDKGSTHLPDRIARACRTCALWPKSPWGTGVHVCKSPGRRFSVARIPWLSC